MQFAALATGVLSAEATKRAGDFRRDQYESQAKDELDSARDREIERRRRLISALASQNAEAGALGATPGIGSVAAIAKADARRASYESLADRVGTSRRTLLLKSAAKQATKQAKLGIFGTAADTASSFIGSS